MITQTTIPQHPISPQQLQRIVETVRPLMPKAGPKQIDAVVRAAIAAYLESEK